MGKRIEGIGDYTLTELRGHARDLNIRGRSKMTPVQLYRAVLNAWDDQRRAKENALIKAALDSGAPIGPGTMLRYVGHPGCVIRVTSNVTERESLSGEGRGPLSVQAEYVSLCDVCERNMPPLSVLNSRGGDTHMLWQLELVPVTPPESAPVATQEAPAAPKSTGYVKRQFCRKCQRLGVPAVTLTFDNGARRLHWCPDHVEDAERYRADSDQREAPAPVRRDATGRVTDRYQVRYALPTAEADRVQWMIVELREGYTSFGSIPKIIAARHGVDVRDVVIASCIRTDV